MAVSLLAVVSACGTASAATTSQPAVAAATPTPDLTGAASAAYADAFNTMNTAEAADIPKENSTDPSVSTAGINEGVTLRETFDTAVGAIQFPESMKADVQAVLSADASLESLLGELGANTDNIQNYNSIFTTMTSGEAAFKAADAALSRDLGLTNSAP